MNNIINKNGKGFDLDQWESIIQMMDDEIREELHFEMAPCTEQDFMTAYESSHESKYGEVWELSKANPIW